jgi:protein-S-isoprenylcysteine O-methyltransferase Ste14
MHMPASAYTLLAAGWVVWLMPFFLVKRNSAKPEKRDRRARWGIVLEGLAYSLLWQSKFWARPPENWRMALSVFFFISAGLLSWTGVRALGRQWRVDAGLNADHELVQSGIYRVVRHPIYTSMLCLLLGTGFMITPLPMLLLSLLLFMIGTEIRVRIEDGLLAARFGDQFRKFQRRVPALHSLLRSRKPLRWPALGIQRSFSYLRLSAFIRAQ